MNATYQLEPDLEPREFVDVLERSTLAEHRPVDDPDAIRGMLRDADLIVTATSTAGWSVSPVPSPTGRFCTYLSDLAVDMAHQGQGIGRELLRRTHQAAGLHTTLYLVAAPKAETYYPHIGMTQHHSCWFVPRQVPVRGPADDDS